MDHIGVLKRAWHITWRYKILWLFGLFAGGAGGGGGGGGVGRGGATWTEDATSLDWLPLREMQRIGWWVQDNIALIAAVVAFLLILGFAMFIISIAAKGGLIHLVNEAEEGRPVRGMDGWAAGFRAWFRVFGIGFVLYAPYTLLALTFLLLMFAPVFASLLSGGEPRPEAFIGVCGGFALGGIVLLVLGILIGWLETLAVRHTVLDHSGVFASIGGAWTDIRVRFKDVIVMWLLIVAVGIAFGVVVGIVAAIFGVSIVAAIFAETYAAAAVAGAALFFALLLPSAIFGAFGSAIWTVFFRRLTGREVVAAPPGAAPSAPMPPVVPTPPVAPPAAPTYAPAPPIAPTATPPQPAPPVSPSGPPTSPPPPEEG